MPNYAHIPQDHPCYDALTRPPFRVMERHPALGALVRFGAEGIPLLREARSTAGQDLAYWDSNRRNYTVGAEGVTLHPLKTHLFPAAHHRRWMRGEQRRAVDRAADRVLCESVTVPTIYPNGRIWWTPWFRHELAALPGEEMTFRFAVRQKRGKRPLPVVVFLHGGGGGGRKGGRCLLDALPARICLWLRGKRCHWVIPHTYYTDFNSSGFSAAIGTVLASLPRADLERVAVIGISYGGYGAVMECVRHPERYAAAVPVVPWMENLELLQTELGDTADEYQRPLEAAGYDALARTPVWFVSGKIEQKWVQPMRDNLRDRGAPVHGTMYPRGGHNLCHLRFWPGRAWSSWLFAQRKNAARATPEAMKEGRSI
ncbi:MAG: prolyl oligopeptidase family serine peptidase [Oscillospiraceae bacterium]|nr:prolyl oligopeptidase family serine peptidase [Oscillospiraceae bacterium]